MSPPGSTALAVLLALLVVAAPLRGQAGAPQDEVRYRDPDGTIRSIGRAEHQSRVTDLRQLIDDLNSNRMVLITESDSPIPVPYQRLQDIAKYLEKKGGLTALEVPGWINDQLEKSREMIPTLTRQLEGLTTVNPQNPAGSTEVEWPVPMDWQKVKGTLNVTHRTKCVYYDRTTGTSRTLPLEEPAHFTLQGDGKVFLIFGGDGISGTIVPSGVATGSGSRTLPFDPPLESHVRLESVLFSRMNDELVMVSARLAVVPDGTGSYCEESELIPEERAPADPYADQFPDPMSWTRTKGEVQGEFFVHCFERLHAESGLVTFDLTIKGDFRVRLDGSGRVDAEFGHETPRHQVQANARIEDRDGVGRALLTGTGRLGQYHWDLRLVRDGDRIDLEDPYGDSGLRVVPVNSTVPCNPPGMFNVK